MGNCNSSSDNNQYSINQRELESIALRNFNQRIEAYSYTHHGNYYIYIEQCKAEYELECIPESCRQGNRFNGW
jgi:hypothetical protein